MAVFPNAQQQNKPDSQLSLDEFIIQASVDKDEIGNPFPGSETQPQRTPVRMPGQRRVLSPEEEAKLSAETASAAGEQFATMADNLNRTLCSLIGGEKDEKYKISSGQRRDLSESYGRIAKHYGFGTTNPLFEGIFLSVLIFAPKYREAFQDKRYKALQDEQEKQKQEMIRMKSDLELIKIREQIKTADNATTTEPANATT